MSLESLKEKKEKIITLRADVDLLRQKEIELKNAELDYYKEYFNTDRELFARLTDIPEQPEYTSNGLYEYGYLCVDTVGKIIRDLIRRYEHKDVIAQRDYRYVAADDPFSYPVREPFFIVGPKSTLILGDKSEENIILNYSKYRKLHESPTNNPVYFEKDDSGSVILASNYNYMFGSFDGLAFETYGREYIKEIVYSIAYFQKQQGIKQLGQRDTWNVYERILYRNLKK